MSLNKSTHLLKFGSVVNLFFDPFLKKLLNQDGDLLVIRKALVDQPTFVPFDFKFILNPAMNFGIK